MSFIASSLLLLGSAIFLVAFWIYNKGVLLGKNLPAFAAWGMFSLITLVNCLLNWTGSFVTIAVLLTDCIVCIGTATIIVIRLKGNVKIDFTDKLIMLVSLIAVGIWIKYNAAAMGNWINQIAYTLTFIPTYRNGLANPRNEPTKPWLLWSMAFVLNIIALALQPGVRPIAYLSPTACLMHHAALTCISLRKPKSQLAAT